MLRGLNWQVLIISLGFWGPKALACGATADATALLADLTICSFIKQYKGEQLVT